MDFTYNDTQRMLFDMVDRFLADRHSLAQRAVLAGDRRAQDAFWREMAELGLMGTAFPEALGGFATSGADAMVVMDRMGRHLVTAPYLHSAIIGGRLLIEGLAGTARTEAIAAVIAGDCRLALAAGSTHMLHSAQDTSFTATRDGSGQGAGWSVSGRMPVVPGGDRADRFIVAARTAGSIGERAGVSLFLIDADAPGLARRTFSMIDAAGAAELVLDKVALGHEALLGEVDAGLELVETALDHGTVAVCNEAVGAMEYLIPATADYTKTRVQYDAPLSRFQVLQHRMADMYIQKETARSMALVAAMSLDGPPHERARMASAAKLQVGRSGKFVGYQAVQLHGGMGVSEELDIGHHYIRLHVINQLFGDTAFHARRFGTLAAPLAA